MNITKRKEDFLLTHSLVCCGVVVRFFGADNTYLLLKRQVLKRQPQPQFSFELLWTTLDVAIISAPNKSSLPYSLLISNNRINRVLLYIQKGFSDESIVSHNHWYSRIFHWILEICLVVQVVKVFQERIHMLF